RPTGRCPGSSRPARSPLFWITPALRPWPRLQRACQPLAPAAPPHGPGVSGGSVLAAGLPGGAGLISGAQALTTGSLGRAGKGGQRTLTTEVPGGARVNRRRTPPTVRLG